MNLQEHLHAPPKELLLAQTENYVEYNRKGKVIKGAEQAAVRSKYEEDVHPLNHTSVFGSWYKDGKWGYRCCHSLMKNSYCIGEQGYALEAELPIDGLKDRLKVFGKEAQTSDEQPKEKSKKKKEEKGEKDDKEQDECTEAKTGKVSVFCSTLTEL